MNNFFYGLIITFIAGFSTLLGCIISFFNIDKNKLIVFSLSFSSGIMISISLLDLIPSSFLYLNKYNNVLMSLFLLLLFIFIGMIVFVFLDKFIKSSNNLYRVGIFSMFAILLHNIPEGIITFFVSSSNLKLGLIMCIGIILHNIPEGISIFVPLYYGTNNKRLASLYTFVAGFSEFIGGLIFYLLFSKYINEYVLGFIFSGVSGMMLYLSIFELFPSSLKLDNKFNSIVYFMLGIIFFYLIHLLV